MNEISTQSMVRGSQARLGRQTWRCLGLCMLVLLFVSRLQAEVSFTSPGLAPTHMDDQGRLVEDWGSITVNVAGTGLPATAPASVQSTRLDSFIPAAQAQSSCGTVGL